MHIRISMVVLLFLFDIAAEAGSWSSGGSELLGDTRNPWFLSNISEITYCILLDTETAGVSFAEAETQVIRALNFWKREFSYAALVKLIDFGKLRIGTQTWQKRSCANADDHNVDIKFQFGIINQEQEDYIKSPTNYAAISVRTDYDRESLRGKGFIYVSPVKGRLGYKGAIAKPDLWSKNGGNNLYSLLQHELGHVHGLPHMGMLGQLMSEGFAENIIDSGLTFTEFFNLPNERRFCPGLPLRKMLKKLFSIPENVGACLRFAYSHSKSSPLFKETLLNVFATTENLDPEILVGTANLTLSGFFPTFGNYIWLTPLQRVFSARDLTHPGSMSDRIPGVSLFRFTKKGIFHPSNGNADRSVVVRFEQGHSMIYGSVVLDNELYDSIF